MRRNVRMLLLLTMILTHLFTARVPRESWSISQSSIWWKYVLRGGIMLPMPINSLSITVELLANGTLLFTLASGTILYRSGPPLLCGANPSGMDQLGTVMHLFTLE